MKKLTVEQRDEILDAFRDNAYRFTNKESYFKRWINDNVDWDTNTEQEEIDEKVDPWERCNCPDCGRKMCNHNNWEG